MTLEQDNSRATWQSSDAESWDPPPAFSDFYDTSTPEDYQQQLPPQAVDDMDDIEEGEEAPFSSWDTLQRFARQFSPVLVPLPFAILIYLFALPVVTKGVSYLPALPLAIILLALVVIQGTLLYYAGSNDGLWTLYIICGYLLFLLVGVFAIFGPGLSLFLLLILLIAGAIAARRSFRPVSEGYVDLVFIFGKYTRTLFPGLNFLLPWEKAGGRLSTREITWTSKGERVNISRDQDVELVVTVSYQLMPEDAHLAALNMQNWEASIHDHFVGIMKSVVRELSPADYVAWSHHIHGRTGANVDVTDPTVETRWDRINESLRRRMQDAVATRGVQVHLVHMQDITLIPHLAPIGNPPPGVLARPVDADIVRAGFHAERVEKTVIVVRKAVALVDRDVQLVGAFDEVEAVNRERRFGFARKLPWVHLFEIRVRAVTADAVRVEQPDAEHEVVGRLRRAHLQTDRHRVA